MEILAQKEPHKDYRRHFRKQLAWSCLGQLESSSHSGRGLPWKLLQAKSDSTGKSSSQAFLKHCLSVIDQLGT